MKTNDHSKTKVDLEKLKNLREITGVSYDLCRKALMETKNDIEASKKKLSEWGIEASEKKSRRETNQGAIFSYVHHNGKVASLVTLLCETDFVASNKDFQDLGKKLAMQCTSSNPKSEEDFLKLPYLLDESKTVDTVIKDLILKIGENIKLSKFVRFEL